MASTVDAEDVARFSAIADEWWDPIGKFKPLHQINPLRVAYICEQIKGHWGLGTGDWGTESSSLTPNPQSPMPLTLLDIGCGGGLVCEPMARLGARVTGIDASEKNIAVASLHAQKSGLGIDYRCTTAEGLLESWVMGHGSKDQKPMTNDLFDIVLALEIVEHVADVPAFVAASAALVKPGGLLIYSTLNRTAKSFALAIVGAEYVMRMLPRGTHDWHKFLKPSELSRHLRASGIEITGMTGMTFSPLNWKWQLDACELDVNYLIAGKK